MFKIDDRVRIITPTNDKLQANYFEHWLKSPVGMLGTIEYNSKWWGEYNSKWWGVRLDQAADTGNATYWVLGFPENELELVSSTKTFERTIDFLNQEIDFQKEAKDRANVHHPDGKFCENCEADIAEADIIISELTAAIEKLNA